MLTHERLQAAQDLVYQHLLPTPTLAWPQIVDRVGTEVWLKHENHTPIGAFKVRGGLVYAQQLAQQGFSGEIVTATRGNHGQSIPYAACRLGMTVKVFVPHGNSNEKNAAMRHWGAQVIEHGRDFDEARLAAEQLAQETGSHLIPSFHEDLVAGVATYGVELFDAITDLDVVYVPVGMGSGACSLIAVRDLLGRQTDIVGVVSTQADALARSFKAGEVVHTETAQTFADGVATRIPHPTAFAIMQQGLADVVCVSDDEIAGAMRLIYRATHNVAEGAGAAALAAIIQQRQVLQGKKVAAILTGGNIDLDWFVQVLNGQTPSVT